MCRGQMTAERIEAPFPERAPVDEPGFRTPQRLVIQPTPPLASALLADDEPGVFEHAEVLVDGRQGHLERRGELPKRRFGARETLEHRTAAAVGKRLEYRIERVIILRHSLKSRRDGRARQGVRCVAAKTVSERRWRTTGAFGKL